MSTSGLTFEEMSESVTGFDEIAVEKQLGIDLYTDGQRKPVLLVRALVFIHLRRAEGGNLSDAEAKKKALGMTLKQANDYFEDVAPELDPNNPETPEGEDDSAPATEPSGALTSVS